MLFFFFGDGDGLACGELAQIDIPIGDVGAVGLEFDLFFREDRDAAIPIIKLDMEIIPSLAPSTAALRTPTL